MSFIKFDHVTKDYDMGALKYRAANDISFDIEKGEFVIVLGPSGAGKSTLLNLLGGLDYVTEGSILIDGDDITRYNENDLTAYRKDSIGFVFQFYNLIPVLTAYENVSLIKAIKK
ncbi:MAG: ATP-binding cassette domain-containing protein, partial [Herbinix sp.]|nr:ATP-binding cassette domain-containing protein [Herbinix sp.]